MNIENTIYLDHQATTRVDSRVLAEMAPYFGESFGNPHSSDHSPGWEAHRSVEKSAERIARLIGADIDEIVFTSGATESNNMALLGLGRAAVGSDRRRILVSAIEHKCVLASTRVLQEQYGFTVEHIPVDRQGHVELSALDGMLDDDVLAVSIMAVNNEIGTIQDIEKISGRIRRHGAVVHCHAAQAPVATPTVTPGAHADIMTPSGHKMYGPKGIGIIFIERSLQHRIEPLIYGGGQQNGLRSGTVPVPLCAGMGMAADLLAGEEAISRRAQLRRRRDTFVERLNGLTWPVAVNGPDGEDRHPGNANVRFPGFVAQDILASLQPRVAASTGSACTSGIPEPSHVLRAIGLDGDDADASIRFSLGFDTTDNEVEHAVVMIDEVLADFHKLNRYA